MTIVSRHGDPFTQALSSSTPFWSLRDVARGMLESGMDRATVLDRFESLREEVRRGSHPEHEDAVLEVMDVLEDWAPPHLRI